MSLPDDEKLDAMLRDVSVPAGLKQRLLRIPGEPAVGVPGTGWTIGKRLVGLALAAGLAGIAVWLAWPTAPNPVPVAVETVTPMETVPDPGEPALAKRSSELAMEIELLLKRLNLKELESRLHALERSAPVPALPIADAESLAICLADQSALAWGAEPESVRADMQKIIDLYPNTAGARTAIEVLARIADSNSMNP